MRVKVLADFIEAHGACIDIDYPKNIEVIIDVKIPENLTPIPENTVRFFVTVQPEGAYNKIIKENQHCYNYLLTAFDDLLELPNSHLFIGCGSFLKPDPDIDKKFAVSTVMSSRCCLPGHHLRFELWRRRHEVNIPFDFYLGTWNYLPEEYYKEDGIRLPAEKLDKIRVFDCMFHIAIDSYRRKNHYSEKLVDCFVTKTVPIYWGCTNVADYFDTSGILEAKTVDDIIYFCNSLTEKHHESFKKAVDNNYNLALEQYNYGDMLKNIIEKCLL